jgi:hypothetical protein
MISQNALGHLTLRSVRLGLDVVRTGCRLRCNFGRREVNEIENYPTGEEANSGQVKEYVAIDETVHNAEHDSPLPGLKRSEKRAQKHLSNFRNLKKECLYEKFLY